MEKRKERSAKVLAPVVQNVDKAIRWLNLYVVDNAISFPITLIHWIVIYPVDSSIHRLNNQSLVGERFFCLFASRLAFAGSKGKKPLSPCVVKDQITFCKGFSGLIAVRRSSNMLTIFNTLNYYFK